MNGSKASSKNPYLAIIIVFIVVSAIAVVFSKAMDRYGLSSSIIIGGNLLLFLVSILSYLFYRKALISGNTQVFLRNVYSGMFIKFFVCLIGAFAYIYLAGKAVNTKGLFALMFLYMVYTFLELSGILKQSKTIKQQTNG